MKTIRQSRKTGLYSVREVVRKTLGEGTTNPRVGYRLGRVLACRLTREQAARATVLA